MKGVKIFLKKIFLLSVCKENRAVFPFCNCTVLETVCASSLALHAYQIGQHLDLIFSGHLDLYSQQANPNFWFLSEQIPLVFLINNVPRLE
jgi:hypothetical protein